MKNLFLVIVFFTISKLMFAENCNVQFSIAAKNNTWKQLDYTMVNGVIYIDMDVNFDSLSFKLLKNSTCTNLLGLSSCTMNDQPLDQLINGTEIKTSATGGLYKILIVGPNNSDWYKIFVRITKSTGVKNAFSSTNFNIYPNPVINNFTVENTHQVESVKIHDITGAVVMVIDNNLRKDVLEIDISKLPAGQYFLAFYNDSVKVTKKLVKQ